LKQTLADESRVSVPEKLARVASAARLITGLEARGLLLKQCHAAASKAELERRYSIA